MGTTYAITVARPPSGLEPHEVRDAIDEELASIDRAMSGYRADSEISRFNMALTTEWVEVSPALAEVVQAALKVSEDSQGAFDITVAPLVSAWGFGAATQIRADLPDPKLLLQLQETVGYRKLHVRKTPAALRKDVAALSVDLNGIAPGFAVDRIASRFDALGFANYMIDIGGEIRVRGHNAEGEKWRIAVEEPIESAHGIPFRILSLQDAAVATSGEYRHYYYRNGKRYSHTIDPRTAQPVNHDLASVVVVHQESMYADAWATAYNVLGYQAGYELALQLRMPVLFIVDTGDGLIAHSTSAMSQYTLGSWE
jgi:thiamine biosynthesis lipoprotein